jgi:hypothetical protein
LFSLQRSLRKCFWKDKKRLSASRKDLIYSLFIKRIPAGTNQLSTFRPLPLTAKGTRAIQNPPKGLNMETLTEVHMHPSMPCFPGFLPDFPVSIGLPGQTLGPRRIDRL